MTQASCPASHHMLPSCHRRPSSLPSPFHPSHIFRVLDVKKTTKESVNCIMGPQHLRTNHFHHRLEFTPSRWTGLELHVLWMKRSYCISVLGGFPSLGCLPGSAICPSCEFLLCSLSASFLLFFLSVSSAAFSCLSLRSR